jgi:hypothetical protein
MDPNLGDSVVIAAIMSWLIQALKGSPAKGLTWISKANPNIIRIFSSLLAALTAAGMTWDLEGGTLTITGLTAANVVAFGWAVGKQYVFQEGSFRLMFKPKG